jgi:O-antigen/teichoic acid export membrane protein
MVVPIMIITSNYTVITMLLGCSFFAMSIAEVLGARKYRAFPVIVIGQRAVQVGLSLTLYMWLGVEGLLLGYGLSLLIFSYAFFRNFRRLGTLSENQETNVGQNNDQGLSFFWFVRSKSRFIVHAYLNSLAQSLSLYVDKLMIGAMFGFFNLGLYQLGFQFLVFLTVIPVSLTQYLLTQEASGLQRKLVKKIGLLLSFGLAVASFFAIAPVVEQFFPHFVDAIPPARITVLAIIPMTANAIMNAKLLGNEKSAPVLLSSGVYIASLFVLIILLGNAIGLLGLSIAFVVSVSVQTATLLLSGRGIIFKKGMKQDGT